ncbi:hypothetical protein MPNT_90007 [Candidatus Methylacidithermus pantelleriae]|uniref:Uncharacterized protein n=1 Tax=Candidatus Methylacidithermus pantelleriae TaxID=2744239 RepID=A0A8J2BPW0_9BACT|nr:hypothetical protein MPNT_90007 [Candidatus Methylacidithermus pantelleriae]
MGGEGVQRFLATIVLEDGVAWVRKTGARTCRHTTAVRRAVSALRSSTALSKAVSMLPEAHES